MGKKDKKKGKGKEKTAAKTEKKLAAKQRKELAAIDEDDIDKILAKIEEHDRKKLEVKEWRIIKPTRRANFAFCAHPTKEELILFGGEYFNGLKTFVFNDLMFYNISKNEWTVVQAPSPPPPRCGHQMVALAKEKGQLWVFGGEFTSTSQNQFHHYKDLWVFHMGDKKWEKITSPNGPSPRSGHRMIYYKNNLIIFGGYHDNLRNFKYYNDVYAFSLDDYKWSKIEASGTPPAPRSACQMVALPDGKILIHGGYCKQTIKKNVDKGIAYSDSYLLFPDKNDSTGQTWKWSVVKLGGTKLSPRSGVTVTVGPGNQAYSFGGVFDEEEDDEDISGKFFNDLHVLDLDRKILKQVSLTGLKSNSQTKKKRRRVKDADESAEKDMECEEEGEGEEEEEEGGEKEEEKKEEVVTTVTDGVFTMTVGPSKTNDTASSKSSTSTSNIVLPPPRMNCGLAVKHKQLYLFGGIFEDGDKQLTLSDMYSLDLNKLDTWKVILKDDEVGEDWVSSEPEEDDDESEESEDEDDESEESGDEDEKMEELQAEDNKTEETEDGDESMDTSVGPLIL